MWGTAQTHSSRNKAIRPLQSPGMQNSRTIQNFLRCPARYSEKMSLHMGDKCTPSSDYMDGHTNLRSGYLIYPLPPNFLPIVAAKLFNLFFSVALPCYCWNISIYFWIVFATILSWCTATTY